MPSLSPARTSFWRVPILATLLALAAFSGPAIAQQASLSVSCGIATVCNANNTSWSLDKDLDSQTSTGAVFSVTVNQVDVSHTYASFSGSLVITNAGSAPASVGSILVNLQRKRGKNWITASTDIANSTVGDAATSARICSPASSESLSSFSENAASGALEFTDANNNTLFAINSPAFVIAAGASVSLNYEANFDNSVLNIPAGESVRAEAIVTFANAGGRGGSGASCSRVDANGSGTVESVETWVRSVPCRTTTALPAVEASNAQVTLTDTPDNVSSTGTVLMTGFDTTIGGGSGIEELAASGWFSTSVDVDVGESGGTLTNSATLAAAVPPACNTPVDLYAEATATFTVNPPDDPPDPPAQLCSYTQGGWGGTPHGNNPATLLAANFASVYPTGVTVGGTQWMKFTSSAAVGAYLPAGSTPGTLTSNLTNPTSTSAGVFGGQVLTLQLNVDMSNMGVTPSGFGDLLVDGGLSVAQVLAAANAALGGAPVDDLPALNDLVTKLNESMDNCETSCWGAQHLGQ